MSRWTPVLCASLLIAGCDGGDYSVLVEFEPETLAGDAQLIEVSLVADCASQALGDAPNAGVTTIELSRGQPTAGLEDVDPGTYGLYGRARSDSCDVTAAGCETVEVEAGGEGTLRVILRAVAGPGCEDTQACVDGRCVAAIPDAGVPEDTGGCSCDDDNPCTRDACDADGACTSTNDDALMCPGGTCHDGACCEGCFDGSSCQATVDDTMCGSAGSMCTVCDPTACPPTFCTGGGCDLRGAISMGTRTSHFCAVVRSGELYCWGAGTNGRLGVGDAMPRNLPTLVGTGYAQVDPGRDHTCAVKGDGTLFCWGSGGNGRLGTGDNTGSPVPVQAGTDTDWRQVSGGTNHTCAIKTDGTLWCWGANGDGQAGLGAAGNTAVPTQVGTESDWQEVYSRSEHTCGIRAPGLLFCWGQNMLGQLGLGAASAGVDVPTQVGTDDDWSAVRPGGSAAATSSFTCGLKSTGAILCWGANSDAQLGLGINGDQAAPMLVGADTDWASIEIGSQTGCAIKTSGALFCWGNNGAGQLGLGDTMRRDVPTAVGTDTDWTLAVPAHQSACGVRMNGTVDCWGDGAEGKLGDGMGMSRTSPATSCL